MGGKKWCEYCRINIEYTREAIQAHQETRLHEQNKQRSIKHQMHQNRKQANANRKLQIEARQNNPKSATGGTSIAPITPSLNPPKPKVSQERLAEYRKQQDEFKSQAFSKIHSLIAQKTKGEFGAPVQFPENNPLLLKDSYYEKHSTKKPKLKEKDSESGGQQASEEDEEEQQAASGSDSQESEDVRMWRIERCEETGKACFINNITGTKLYEKPTGFFLSDKEQQAWDQLQQHVEQNPQADPNIEGNVGEWEEVPQEQNYFEANALPEESSESEVQQLEDIQRPRTLQEQQLGQIEKKILKGEITTADQVVSMMINSATQQTGQSLRQKNAKLKKLIESNFQETVRMDRVKEMGRPDDEIRKVEGFRPRKQVKKVQLTTEEDLY